MNIKCSYEALHVYYTVKQVVTFIRHWFRSCLCSVQFQHVKPKPENRQKHLTAQPQLLLTASSIDMSTGQNYTYITATVSLMYCLKLLLQNKFSGL